MRKTLFIAITAMASLALPLLSCQKNAGVSEKEKSLKLEAPSGERVASTIQEFKRQAAEFIGKKFGNKPEFDLTSIQYLPVEKGYAAIISYQLADGTRGNYGIFYNVKYELDANAAASRNEEGRVTISCDKEGSCDCELSGTVNADTGVITVSCGCSTCKVKVSHS